MEIRLTQSPEISTGKIQLPWSQLSPVTAEAIVSEFYRADLITFKQAQQLLNHTHWQQTAAALENYGCDLYYDQDDFKDDIEALSTLLGEETA